jgi:hypothetical protein
MGKTGEERRKWIRGRGCVVATGAEGRQGYRLDAHPAIRDVEGMKLVSSVVTAGDACRSFMLDIDLIVMLQGSVRRKAADTQSSL